MAEITVGRVLDADTDSVTVEQGGNGVPWLTSSPLVPVDYDAMSLGYTDTKLTSVVYKKLGTTVATLTLSYTGDQLTSVARA